MIEKILIALTVIWIIALVVVTVMACFNPSYAYLVHHVSCLA